MIDLKEIIPDQESKDNYRSLCELYKNNAPIIIFFGAGLGNIPGIPTWDKLLELLCKKVKMRYMSLKGKYWDKASKIEKRYNEKKQDVYDEIKSLLQPIHTEKYGIHNILIKGENNAFITTNYDNIFSEINKDLVNRLNEQFYPDFNPSRILGSEIIYLHGNIFNSNDIVFTSDQYTNAYKKFNNIKSVIESAYWYNSIIFIGFSFEDEFFAELYTNIQKNEHKYYGHMREKAPRDYIIFSTPYEGKNIFDEGGLDNLKKKFIGKYNLLPIAYNLKFRGEEKGHIKLEKILKELLRSRPSKTI
nr:SIR2 family protein [Bacteroidota bacterium]